MRIVIEAPCEHDIWIPHGGLVGQPYACSGGSRRVLPEGSVVISKENGEWPKWAKTVIHEWTFGVQGDHPATELLDTLADGVGADHV